MYYIGMYVADLLKKILGVSTKIINVHMVQLVFQFSSVLSLIHVPLFAAPWTEACQASLSITNSQSLLKLTSIQSVMLSNHLILYRPLLLLPSIFPNIRVFSKESRHEINPNNIPSCMCVCVYTHIQQNITRT